MHVFHLFSSFLTPRKGSLRKNKHILPFVFFEEKIKIYDLDRRDIIDNFGNIKAKIELNFDYLIQNMVNPC